MKKNEIILARIISTASAFALALLVLVAGIKSSYFSNIINKINNNTITGDGANLYNYYYYSGLNVIYRFLFVISVIAMIISIMAILFRLKHCQLVCKITSIILFVISLFLIFSRVYETSVGTHKFIDGFYMGNVSGNEIVTAQLLPKYPIWTFVLLFLSVIIFMLVRVTKFEKIKMYTNMAGCDALHLLIAGTYGAVVLDVIRDYLVLNIASGLDTADLMAYYYLKEYFVSERWLLCIPLVVYISIAVVLVIVLRNKCDKKVLKGISIGIPTGVVLLIGIYYIFNPAQIFGRLTLDEHICDVTENAMMWYVLQLIAAVLFTSFLICYTYTKMSLNKLLIVIAANLALGGIFLIAGRFLFGLSGMYAGLVVADIVSCIVIVLYSNKVHEKRK